MRRAKVVTIVLLTMVIAAGSVATAPVASARPAPGESTLYVLTNAARARHGVPRLVLSAGLSTIARRHSAEMATQGDLHHTANLAYAIRRYQWRIAGENVGVGPTMQDLSRAFILSRPHRANILNRNFRSVGVGVVYRAGVAWVTVIFIG